MAMPQCCYLAKGAKRPSHTTNTMKFDRIPFDPCNSIKRFDLCPFDQKNLTYLQPPPNRVLYSRHQLLTSKQRTDENITDYVKRLEVLVQKCNCAAITAQQHQESLIRDALIAGNQSDGIQTRLLELNDGKASLDDCLALASAIEVRHNYRKPLTHITTRTLFTQQLSQTNLRHPKMITSLSAEEVITILVQVGFTQNHANSVEVNGTHAELVLLEVILDTTVKNMAIGQRFVDLHRTERTLSHLFYVQLKPIHQSWMSTLMASEATQLFISCDLLAKNNICNTKSESQTKLANLSTLSTLGFVQLKFELAGCHHENQFIVADTLVKDIIIGMDVLSQHRGLELQGSLPRLNVKHESMGYLSAVFPALDIEPPLFSSNFIQAAKPISTETRFCKKKMANSCKRKLHACWRAILLKSHIHHGVLKHL